MMTSTKISSSELSASLDLLEIKPGVRFSVGTLRDLLPDVETVLFFGKVYGLDASQLAALLHAVLNSDLSSALFAEGMEHSNELQDYLLDGYEDEWGDWHQPIVPPAEAGDVVLKPDVPTGEILPHVWKDLEVVVATSIQAVAEKLEQVVNHLPGKQGSMVFRSMMTMNAKRPVIGDFRAQVHHERQQQNLLILDVSASMSASTIQRIVDDVVALSYTANAHMAVVSNTTTFWEPGTYDVDAVLAACEFSGTHYETLADVLSRDWGTVITVADYDSSASAKQRLRREVTGSIDTVIDVSLVNQPTFLAECVGQFAGKVQPLLIGSSAWVLSA
jgi:hypothetical protein